MGPRSRRGPDPWAGAWKPLVLPLLASHPARTPNTLLQHLREQKPDQNWGLVVINWGANAGIAAGIDA